MKRFFLILLVVFLNILLMPLGHAFAIENPLSLPNNKIGVHILFPQELNIAAKLVNNNGDWGHIVIPIQAGDRDLEKWQKFMDSAKQNHIIPIIRLATEGDYFNTAVWRKPTYDDVLDFANFLNSLSWPVKNRYIIIFNEVNRGDEWGGTPSPEEYARILTYSIDVFKSLSEDFFIISAGLDNGASDIPNKAVDQYSYMTQMNKAISGVFGKIDGLGSHSYPNPAFAVPPWNETSRSISSFKFEGNLAFNLSGKALPIFITETGWSSKRVPDKLSASYFEYAFKNVWSDKNIVAVAPFLLQAGPGPFFEFSLLNEDGGYSEISKTLAELTKIKGQPTLNRTEDSYLSEGSSEIPLKTFPKKPQYNDSPDERIAILMPFLEWLLKLNF